MFLGFISFYHLRAEEQIVDVRTYVQMCISVHVEPHKKGHFGTALIVPCKEVVLFGRSKMY